MNADLFIKDAAMALLAHDLNAYAATCNQRFDPQESQEWYQAHCSRYLGLLGMFVGPFTGLFT